MEKAMTIRWGGPVQTCILGQISPLRLAAFSDVHLKNLEIIQHPDNPTRRENQREGSGAWERTGDCSPAPVQIQRHSCTAAEPPELIRQPRWSSAHPSPLPFAAASLFFSARRIILPLTPVRREPVPSPGGAQPDTPSGPTGCLGCAGREPGDRHRGEAALHGAGCQQSPG